MLQFLFIGWLLFLIFASYVSKKKFGFITNHYFLTNVYWAICLYISIFHNYYVHPVSNEIYYIFFIGSFFFNLTLFTTKIKKIPQTFECVSYSVKKRRLLEIIAVSVVIPMAYTNLEAIISGGELWRMYEEYWIQKEENGYLEEFLKQNIITPVSFVLMATCFFVDYRDRKKNSVIITISIAVLLALLNMLMTAGGRTGLMQFMFFIFLSYVASFYVGNSDVVYKISRINITIIALIGVGAFSLATIGRGDENVFDIVAERISLFPAVFEAHYKTTNECQGYALGLSMFEQPISFILYPFKLLGMDVSFERISTIVAQDIWTPATECLHNAAASAYTFYMRDFGVFGVVIGPYIVGKIYNLLWRFCRNDRFLIVFYFSGVCATCFDSTYPFARCYFFAMLFAFFVRNFLKIKYNATNKRFVDNHTSL